MSEILGRGKPIETRGTMKPPNLERVAGIDISEISLSDQETAAAQEFVRLHTSEDGAVDTPTHSPNTHGRCVFNWRRHCVRQVQAKMKEHKFSLNKMTHAFLWHCIVNYCLSMGWKKKYSKN
ncbi:MAG: hypothetical protein COX81_03425 [Candidatus Magasanikbacteria bacterium CG_4_10_14_0_2_um_filter_37_12]|uniref:Uncharacterized protein n=1 Tax=Candidatus Magasanikbacteria bacterium CG_4_10_14_0_2_um_filter_37_12 TaxID=1974637 RepID=A0A2M7V767_9BACT|nr:MAG: hypothetical protein COX81_03425 [Candidatus Magasanikbacteria bacterium CG_4_10_14_0_2_um_filter_37_12]